MNIKGRVKIMRLRRVVWQREELYVEMRVFPFRASKVPVGRRLQIHRPKHKKEKRQW